MIEITFKDEVKGITLINLKNISMVNYSKESSNLVFWGYNNNLLISVIQKDVVDDLEQVFKRCKTLLMRGN